jgi:cation diffusion facilitator CzcD-associated flavoprotein CzcO
MADAAAADVVIIGAGPAGLATARELAARGIEYRLLERGTRAGRCWADTWDSLRLHTGKHFSQLPGLPFPRGTSLFPSRDEFVRYLDAYVAHFDLRVETGSDVTRVEPAPGHDARPGAAHGDARWIVHSSGGRLAARRVVLATGVMSNPQRPGIPGEGGFEGRVLHSVEYRRPDPFRGQRVLVVGAGNSGGEIAAELARARVEVTIAVRSGVNVVPLTLFGLPIQYSSLLVRTLPRAAQEVIVAAVRRITIARRGPPVLPVAAHSPLDSIPLIGFHLVDAILAGTVAVRGGIERFTTRGVRFVDGVEEPFDCVILATGFRAATAPFGPRLRTDARGFALRSDRVTSADLDGVFCVGHNYDSSGGLANIRTDARLTARRIAAARHAGAAAVAGRRVVARRPSSGA